ncbi:hypothetical protein GCM10020218_099950 [Dactylosporangium vinaceum]
MEEGFVEHLGITIHFEVYGERGPTILLMPTWTIVHKRVWKAQVRYLSRHFRVVVYDGPGNGRSDRPLDSAAYSQAAQVGYALAVLDVTGTGRAVQVALSRAANWALQLAAEHPERVLGTVLIGAAVWLPPREHRTGSHEQFAWAFMTRCFPEPHSTKQIEDGVGWALETTDTVLAVESSSPRPDRTAVEDWCARLTSPLLAIHGDDDRIVPLDRSERLAALTGGTLEVIEGGGHIPAAREPVRVNRLISAFARRFGAPAPVRPSRPAKPRMLYLSSPIGLGHARRDLAIARALRALRPDVHVDWLTQHPVTRMLESAGERVHPASRWLANESAHIEAEAGEHDLHCFRALRTMDEILVANFMVFQDLVEAERYDLVVADEAWDVDHFLHEDPALKRSAYAWLTDFVGFLPMPDADARETYVTADYNAEMLDHIAGHPHVRDRSIFVGDPADIVDERFGADLPMIRTWTEANYSFAGYVTGFDPRRPERPRRAARRAGLPPRRAGLHRDRRRLRRRRRPPAPGDRRVPGRRPPRRGPAHDRGHRPEARPRLLRGSGRSGAAGLPGAAPQAPGRLRSRGGAGRPDDLHGADRPQPPVHLRPAPPPLRAALPRAPPPGPPQRRPPDGLPGADHGTPVHRDSGDDRPPGQLRPGPHRRRHPRRGNARRPSVRSSRSIATTPAAPPRRRTARRLSRPGGAG